MKVEFLAIAHLELQETVAYYEGESPGLGDVFMLEILSAIDRIRAFPDAWTPLSENTRRYRIHRFPYGLVYQASGDSILVVAVGHLHREPGFWRDRRK